MGKGVEVREAGRRRNERRRWRHGGGAETLVEDVERGAVGGGWDVGEEEWEEE